uniref:Cytochrome b5 heme-binding domain-containing protein n=1 Tax=Oryza glumipatula TaxID=40148 RepID=A0A0D9YVJ2_9ORYZ
MVKGDRQERCLPSIHLRCRPCHRHLTTFSQGVHSAFAIAMGVHSALSVQCISFPTCRLCRRLNHTDQRHIQQAKSVRVGVADTTTQAQALHRLVSRGSPRPAVPCRGEPSISAAPSKHHPKAVQFALATTAHKHTRTRRGCLLSLPAFPLLCSPLPARALGSCIAPPSTEMVAAAEWWEATIAAYTGLSPAAFFTAVAVAAALYVAVSGLLTRRPPPLPRRQEEARASQPLPPPVQLGEVTEEELRVYDGSDPNKPLLMAIKGQIYDVTQSRMFYGPGGPYALFAGRDASRALAKMSFELDDLTGDVSGLGPIELEALHEWEGKFMSKYVKVGTIKKIIPVSEGDAATLPTHGGTSDRGIDVGTIESNRVPEPEENGATSHADAVEKSDADVSTHSHEDVVEKSDELLESGVDTRSTHEDAVGKPKEETEDADVHKTISTEVAGEGKGAPDEDERNTCSLEDAIEKPKETAYIDVKDTSGHEVAGEPKEAPDVDGNNTSSNQDAVDEPKEASHEAKEA